MIFVFVDFQKVAEMVSAHQTSIIILSFTITAFASFTMLMAFRRIKSEKWMKYFAWAFGLLSVQYLVFPFIQFITIYPNNFTTSSASLFLTLIVLQLLSIANNLCFIAAARDLENKRTLLPKWCWYLAGVSLVTTILGYALSNNNSFALQSEHNQSFYAFLGRSFDAGFSAYSLFLLGYAIFVNLSFRRRPLVALSALIIGSLYATAQIAYGLSPFVPKAGRLYSSLSSFTAMTKLPIINLSIFWS